MMLVLASERSSGGQIKKYAKRQVPNETTRCHNKVEYFTIYARKGGVNDTNS